MAYPATKGNIPHQGWLISQWIEKSDANKIRFNLKSQDKDGFVFRVVAFDESLNAVYTSKNRYGAAVLGGYNLYS
ncbi:unnamed protein product [Oppiella nova]|uniref:Uncharacterized protein n=1 Tax=Oppiella nova TaxID=334625 RepID=A0A7R9QM67_9ACAR|nr:unnamed protein product [Oppiella nova]CAG2167799.1 unnamed protein product [Oppiella nova]